MPDPDAESLRVEYADVGENWRFFIGARFVNLGFFGAFNGALLGVLSALVGGSATAGEGTFLLLLAILGFLLSIAVILIDLRCRVLFEAALQRGQEIERELRIRSGQYCGVAIAGRMTGRLVNHTRALIVVYSGGVSLWLAAIVLCATHAIGS